LRGGHPRRSQTNLSVASCGLTFKPPQKRQVRSGRLADQICLMQAFRFATSIGNSAHTAHKASEPSQPVWTRGPNLPSNLPITNQRETMCSCSTSQPMPFILPPKQKGLTGRPRGCNLKVGQTAKLNEICSLSSPTSSRVCRIIRPSGSKISCPGIWNGARSHLYVLMPAMSWRLYKVCRPSGPHCRRIKPRLT